MEPVLSLPRRLQLQTLLETMTGLPESRVHFQPPDGTQMVYPAVMYSISTTKTQSADNVPYRRVKAYIITVIDKDPDSEIRDKIAVLPYCAFDRWYANDGLNHYVYTLYY